MTSALALLGGTKAVTRDPGDMFTWPIITPEIEDAVLTVLREGNMSGTDVTREFEKTFAAWQGTEYALAHSSGTAALHGAMYGWGIGRGDEIICPTMTYWASCLPVYSLGGTVAFADIDPDTLCIAPGDIEHRINERTRAIVVVHYAGHPADMDAIMDVARRHKVAVIEDCSHAHGSLYKGKMVGTFGDVAAYSIMSGKSLAAGEGGMLVTNDRRIYERALAFGHYSRHSELTLPDLVKGQGLPWGGYKYRMHQLTSAMGNVQLHTYPAQMKEIQKAMNYFWDGLEGVPGIQAHRPPKDSGSTMGGWYAATGLYRSEDVGGLSLFRFCEALQAEGIPCRQGRNRLLHLHPVFNTLDVYGDGRPTRLAYLPEGVDIRQPEGSLPEAERLDARAFSVPWFKHDRPEVIDEYVSAIRKVADHHQELLTDDPGNPTEVGGWGLTARRG